MHRDEAWFHAVSCHLCGFTPKKIWLRAAGVMVVTDKRTNASPDNGRMMKLNIPPNYFYLALVMSTVVYFLFPQFNTIPFPWNLTGFLLIIPGMYLIIRSWQIFMRHGTPENYVDRPQVVVSDDIYRYSRNPMYVGAVATSVGLCVLLRGNLLSFIGPVFFFLVLHLVFIPYEERQMIDIFGDEYREYMRKVRRWV